MKLYKILKNTFLVALACLALSACATSKKTGQMQGDVYTGTDTVEYLHRVYQIEFSLLLMNQF